MAESQLLNDKDHHFKSYFDRKKIDLFEKKIDSITEKSKEAISKYLPTFIPPSKEMALSSTELKKFASQRNLSGNLLKSLYKDLEKLPDKYSTDSPKENNIEDRNPTLQDKAIEQESEPLQIEKHFNKLTEYLTKRMSGLNDCFLNYLNIALSFRCKLVIFNTVNFLIDCKQEEENRSYSPKLCPQIWETTYKQKQMDYLDDIKSHFQYIICNHYVEDIINLFDDIKDHIGENYNNPNLFVLLLYHVREHMKTLYNIIEAKIMESRELSEFCDGIYEIGIDFIDNSVEPYIEERYYNTIEEYPSSMFIFFHSNEADPDIVSDSEDYTLTNNSSPELLMMSDSNEAEPDIVSDSEDYTLTNNSSPKTLMATNSDNTDNKKPVIHALQHNDEGKQPYPPESSAGESIPH